TVNGAGPSRAGRWPTDPSRPIAFTPRCLNPPNSHLTNRSSAFRRWSLAQTLLNLPRRGRSGMRGLFAKVAVGAALASFAFGQVVGQSAAPFEPVTDAMIQDPDPKDWLSWRRTLDSWGYSPLAEITRENVGQLRMVWARPLPDGHNEGTPLVHNGVLYFPGPSDNIQAIDAKSGEVLWQHRRELPEDIREHLTFPDTNRNLAIYGDLLIARGSDDYIYAVNAQTG